MGEIPVHCVPVAQTDCVQASELVSSFIARQVMSLAFGIDVSQIGLDEMREYPELGQLLRTRGAYSC
jgi:hypothetical protein